jgi:dihydrodipicolinate synthase/N-acetylneuraminate lyase
MTLRTDPAIRGTWATLLLPIAPDDSIDWSRLGDEIDYLLSTGVDGIYSNGTAGEFYAQTEAEFDRIQGLLASRCLGRMHFQVGASHPCPHTCVDRARRAKQWAPAAIQVILPDWYPLNPGEVQRFLEAVARAVDPVPLVLYNPPHAKRVLAPEEVGRLAAEIPLLCGVKVATYAAEWIAAVRALAPGLSIFVPGHWLATGIASGADGSYSNVACLQPAGAKAWNLLMDSDPGLALEVEERIQQFFAEFFTPLRARYGVANHAFDKFLAAIGGWADIGTRMRWPYDPLPLDEAERLRPIARSRIPELFP